MPQMAPMNWLSLMLFFIITFMLINMINYYSYCYNVKSYKTKNYVLKINWKW